jgi:hypothetical protein
MKTLNDTLRDEFKTELNSSSLLKKIQFHNLDKNVMDKAFEVLLKFKSTSEADNHLIDKGRSEFENFLINYIRTKLKENDHK